MQWKRLEKQNIMNGLEIHFLKVSDIANEILSNNIFANNDFMQALEQVNAGKLQALYISDKMKENIDLLRESGYFDS